MNNEDYRARFYDEVLGSFEFRNTVDLITNGVAGGYNLAAYNYPNTGDMVFVPSIVHSGVMYYVRGIVIDRGEFTFNIE